MQMSGSALVFVILSAVSCTLVDAALTSTSKRSVTVIEGQPFSFNCRTDSGRKIRWKYYASDTNYSYQLLYNGNSVNEQFTARITVAFDASSGLSRLHIGGVLASDAGSYRCSESHTALGPHELAFQLSVVAEDAGNSPNEEHESDRRDRSQQPHSTTESEAKSSATGASLSSSSLFIVVVLVPVVCVIVFAVLLTVIARCRLAHNGTSAVSGELGEDNKVTFNAQGVRAAISLPGALDSSTADIQSSGSVSHHSSSSGSGSNIYSQINEEHPLQEAIVERREIGDAEVMVDAYSGLDQQAMEIERAAQRPVVYIQLGNASSSNQPLTTSSHSEAMPENVADDNPLD